MIQLRVLERLRGADSIPPPQHLPQRMLHHYHLKKGVNILNNNPSLQVGGGGEEIFVDMGGRWEILFRFVFGKNGGEVEKIQVSKQERIGKFKVYTKKFDTRIIQLDNTQFQEGKPGNLIYLSKKV